MTKICAIMNEKGGVGKSVTSFNICYALSKEEREDGKKNRVLMIDLDPQRANLSFIAGLGKEPEKVTMYDVLVKKTSMKKAVRIVEDDLHIVLADSGVANITADNSNLNRFKMALNEIRPYYDYVFIDVPPGPGQSHVYAVGSADYIIPIANSDIMNLEALMGLSKTIYTARETVNPSLKVLGVLINQYSWRTNLSKQVVKTAEKIAAGLDTVVLKTKIRNNVSISEAVGAHVGITAYDPKSNGSEDVLNLVQELKERMSQYEARTAAK